jgi:hypothetical protein
MVTVVEGRDHVRVWSPEGQFVLPEDTARVFDPEHPFGEEIVAVDLRLALDALGEIVGVVTDVLAAPFPARSKCLWRGRILVGEFPVHGWDAEGQRDSRLGAPVGQIGSMHCWAARLSYLVASS